MTMRMGFIGDNDLTGVEADAKFAREHGFAGLEYNYWGPFRELKEDTVKRMREILDAHGVACSMLGLWGWNHLSVNAAERQEAHTMLNRAIDFAQLLRAELMVTGAGQIEGAPLAEKVKAFNGMFRPFLEKIEAAGMKCAIYAIHGASFLDRLEAYEAIWECFPQIGIKYDPANWQHHGADYLAIIRKCGNRIAHVHIKEHLYHHGELASQPAAGMGDIEWGKVMAFLYEHHYDGYLSIEPHGPIWSRGDLRRTMLLLTQRFINRFLL